MSTGIIEQVIQVVSILKEVEIEAMIDIAFESVLEELGPGGVLPDGTPFPMVLEARPGGRWYRDLGEDAGHFWGHVQVIKPPGLLELCGPMFMSFPGVNHVQYRLTAEGEITRLRLAHQAMGPIPEEMRENIGRGWDYKLGRVAQRAERRASREAK